MPRKLLAAEWSLERNFTARLADSVGAVVSSYARYDSIIDSRECGHGEARNGRRKQAARLISLLTLPCISSEVPGAAGHGPVRIRHYL